MAGNQNSGRKNMFNNPVEIHFQMEKEEAEKLNKIAKQYTNNNRSELIKQTLRRIIETYDKKSK